MRFKYYLFDLDGTLTESEEGITKSAAYALEKMGFPAMTQTELRKFIGPPLLDSFTRFCGMTPEQAEEAVAHYRARYTTVGWKENIVYSGVPRMLRSLKQHGAYIALASSKPAPSCEKILKYFGLLPLFDAISAPDFGMKDPGKAHLVACALPEGADPAEACMVGDRLFDMQGAKAVGVTAVGAEYGYGSREELMQAGADITFDNVDAMTDWMLDGDAPAKGIFLSLEGSDGCGKTTQLNLLSDYLKRLGGNIVLTREPGGTPIAEQIREIILSVMNAGMSDACEALLYAASRAEHVDKVIIPAIERGDMVLSDRFVDSSIAYQGFARELSEGFVRQINSWATDRIMPDATLFLDMDPDAALRRRCAAGEPDRLESEKNEFFRTVYNAYDAMRNADSERFYSVNADQSVEQVHEDVLAAVQKAFEDIDRRRTAR